MKRSLLLPALQLLLCGAALAQYPTQNVTLLSVWDSTQIPQESTYNIRYNGIWGWQDPQDNREYAIIGSTSGTHFVDVTNPSAPIQRDFVAGRRSGCIWREYKTYRNYCYMVSDDNSPNSLQIIDMQYLPDSVHVVYDDNLLIERSHTLFIDGNKLYLGIPKGNSVGGTSMLAVYSLNNPQLPVFLHKIESDNISGVSNSHDMFVRNDTVYASMSWNGLFLLKYDSVANTFTQLGSLTSYPNQGYNHSSALTRDGNLLIFCDEVPAGLPIKALDVSNFGNLTIMSQFRSTSNSTATPHNPFIRVNDNTRLIQAYYQDGVQIFDITNPSNVVRTGYIDTNPTDCPSCPNPNYSGCWGAYVDLPSGIVIASDMQNGLFVINANAALGSSSAVPNSDLVNFISAYPNPSSSGFDLDIRMKAGDQVTCTISDMAGRIIAHETREVSAGNSVIHLQGDDLDAGIYLLTVSGSDFTHTEKLIKED